MRFWRARTSALTCAAWLTLCGACECESRRPIEVRGPAPESLSISRYEPAKDRAFDAGAPARAKPSERAAPEPPLPDEPNPSTDAFDATDVDGSVSEPFIVDSLVDVAAAGPATASARGIVMVNRDNQVQLARIGGALDTLAKPTETAILALPDGAGPFSVARGPAVSGKHAYWVSRGRLLGKSLNEVGNGSGPIVLADDARVGTRVAVPVGPARYLQPLPELAAYIARPKEPDAPLSARVWILGQAERLSLTDDAASANSVALVATADGVAAVFLEARTGMSSLHVRLIQFSQARAPLLGEDRIVWVGGPGRSSTEVFALGRETRSVTGFLTLERDMTHFGLATLSIPLSGESSSLEPEWLLYPNGIEPAPVAPVNLCGRTAVAFARPTSASPHAPQELVLQGIDDGRATRAAVVARSRAFFDVSLATLGRGALLSYVADHRTWARAIRCVAG